MESGTSPSIQALVQLCTHTACQTAAARRGGRKIVDGSPGALPRPSTCRCSSIRPSNCRPGGRVDHISLVSYYLKVITKVSPYRSRHCHIADHVCHHNPPQNTPQPTLPPKTVGNIIEDWPLHYFTTVWVIGKCCGACRPRICFQERRE